MRIGYSFWGFLGPGVLDTPDGGRSHRRPLIDALIDAGHDLTFLQANRDLEEASLDLSPPYRWDHELPDIDVLFLEWRWPIPGRNTTRCDAPGHTCDLHRQEDLVAHYTIRRRTPTLLWDKDLRLPPRDVVRTASNVAVCEPALHPSPGATSLLFPIADVALDSADPAALVTRPRPFPLVYIGNQYDRDDAFSTFFAPAAAKIHHRIVGKWTRTDAWPGLNFTGRCSFTAVGELYSSAVATVLLLPRRYANAGQMTQRIFEATLAGCLPLTPITTRGAARFTPAALHVTDARDVLATVQRLQRLAGSARHAELVDECLHRLDLFRMSIQIATIEQILARLTDTGPS
jgi:hypothetical protein